MEDLFSLLLTTKKTFHNKTWCVPNKWSITYNKWFKFWKIYSLASSNKYKLDRVRLLISQNEWLPVSNDLRLGRSVNNVFLNHNILDKIRLDVLWNDFSFVIKWKSLGRSILYKTKTIILSMKRVVFRKVYSSTIKEEREGKSNQCYNIAI